MPEGLNTSLLDRSMEWIISVAPNIIAAFAIIVAGYLIAKYAVRSVARLYGRAKDVDQSLLHLAQRLIKYAIMILAIVAALGQLGVHTTSLLAALGAIGLAIGLALKDTLSNVASGIMILWLRPFKVGDFVETADASGTITEIGLFATRLKTLEGCLEFVPNSNVWSNTISNFTANGTRMVREEFGICYADDLREGRRILLDLVTSDDRFLNDPAPKVLVTTLGDNSVVLEVRAWTRASDWAGARFDFIEAAKVQLEAGGLSFPFPQQDVYVKTLAKQEA